MIISEAKKTQEMRWELLSYQKGDDSGVQRSVDVDPCIVLRRVISLDLIIY